MAAFEAASALRDAGLQAQYVMDGQSVEPSWKLTAATTDPAAGTPAPQGGHVAVSLALEEPIPHSIEIVDSRAVIWIDQALTIQQAWILVGELAETGLPEGGYFIEINCQSGGTASADNRQANGKLSVGEKGRQEVGLHPGVVTIELREGATCL